MRAFCRGCHADVPHVRHSGAVCIRLHVQPADFTEGEDGLYHAQVTDADAHAWTELFMEDKGWTPVEVTPAAQEPEIEAVEATVR